MARTGDQGSMAIIGSLVAVGIFTVVFYTVVDTGVQRESGSSTADQASYAALATSMADAIFGRGEGWYGGAACVAGVEQAVDGDGIAGTGSKFGLGAESCDPGADTGGSNGALAYSKIANLYSAQLGATANGFADYEEARRSLGLDAEGVDFRVRASPVLPTVNQILARGHQDPHLRPLYIGDYSQSQGGGGSDPPYVKGIIDQADRVIVYVEVTNSGASSTIFDAEFEMELKNGDIDFILHTPVLGPGQSGNMSFTLLKTADWEWKNGPAKKITIAIHDKDTELVETEIAMSSVTMTYLLTRTNVFANAETMSTVVNPGPTNGKYYYAAYDGKGNPASFNDWTFVLYNSLGAPLLPSVLPSATGGQVTYAFLLPDTYTVKLWNDALVAAWNQDVLNVVAAQPGPFVPPSYTYTPGPSVPAEIAFLDALVEEFEPNSFGSTYDHPDVPYLSGGDVYPDIKDAMDNSLPLALEDGNGAPTLDDYNVVVVGSNVDHNVMTSNAAKQSIEEWVYAGGTLIVFGSAQQSVNWLEPIFHSSIDPASGALVTPDPDHPSLSTPNELATESFNIVSEWNYNSGSDADFAHLATAGATGDLLAISDAGAFGDGRIILTGWRPYDLTANQASTCPDPLPADANCQSLYVLHNFLSLAYRELYIDYGAEFPVDVATASISRIATVYHPDLGQHVALAIRIYVF